MGSLDDPNQEGSVPSTWFHIREPLRTLFILYLTSFICSSVTGIIGLKSLLPYSEGLIGGLGTLLGLTLLINFNGTADDLSYTMKTKRWLGADYSKVTLARPVYLRLLGAVLAVLNIVSAVVVITGHNV